MKTHIKEQIANIGGALDWIKRNRPADYDSRFLQLVEERRKLKRILKAESTNPAIAAYGVSQVGKSYLMNSILQKDGNPFMIKGDGKEYNFIEQMNPITNNTEATGVVTRFSSYKRNPEKYDPSRPIMMRCLSVTDVILILSDGYFNDISNYTTDSESEITDFAEQVYQKYRTQPDISGSPLQADDVLEMKRYFEKQILNAQAFLHTDFFDKIALVAGKIPTCDWAEVFGILWKRNKYQNKLFAKMTSTLERLRYSEYVWLPAQALLHDNTNENTIMSVQCLNNLFRGETLYFTDAYIGEGREKEKVEKLSKSEVCAVCAEVVVKIDDRYLETTSRYCFDDITEPSSLAVLRRESITMNLLKDNDMLDFPGARSRKKEQLETLSEDQILLNVLLRGKVSYLFNSYNDARLINILLFCHHGAQNDVTDVPQLLRNWIMTYVGETMAQRRRTLELTGGISPLFYIATKFNIDMAMLSDDAEGGPNSPTALNERWHQRFEKVLYPQCFNADGSLDSEQNKIFLNWTAPEEHFRNSFLLRDYKYSGPMFSKLYESETTEARRMLLPRAYYDNLRSTFVSHPGVKSFFGNPGVSWDAAASIGNDGALYILEQLSKVAERIDATRSAQFAELTEEGKKKILRIMRDYYVDTDADKMLKGNIRKARAVMRELDFTCNNDNYYFGHLIQGLQISEHQAYKVIHKVLQSPDVLNVVNDFKEYEIIRNSCEKWGGNLESATSETEKWEILMDTYGFDTEEEARDFLISKNVEPSLLFSGNFKRKQNSFIVADAVFDAWLETIRSVNFFSQFAGGDYVDTSVMSNLIDNIASAAESVNLRDIMAQEIGEFVNVVHTQGANETLLADLMSTRINEFVLDLGYSYLTAEQEEDARELCRKNRIPAFKYIDETRTELPVESLTALFNDMQENPKALLPSFENNYSRWMEYMFVSFIAHLGVPTDFDFEANKALARILDTLSAQ